MKTFRCNVIVTGVWILKLGICHSVFAAEVDPQKLPPAVNRPVDFASDVQPIFEHSCFRCHGTERPKSHFNLTTRETALKGGNENTDDIVPGDSASSRLIHYVTQLVPDMEMPPPDKAEPLTPGQIGILRAWIDQGANWSDTNLLRQTTFSFSPLLRWTGVSGSSAKFREIEGVRDGWGGGVEQFAIGRQDGGGNSVSAEGRFLFPDEDVKLRIAWTKADAGFIRVGVEHWRKYFDDTGGFAPGLSVHSFALNRDLHLELGRAWIDFGLSRPGWPQTVLGYEFQFKRGDEATLQWGPVGTMPLFPPPTNAKNIFPAAKHIDENTHILKLDVTHELAGWQLADSARLEFYSLETSRRNVLGFPTADTLSRINDRDRHTQGANSLSASRQIAEWLSVSGGYHYSKLEGDASLQQNTMNAAGAFVGGDQWFANDVTLRRESHVASVAGLAGPWHGASLSAGVQGEWTRQDTFGFENLLLGVPAFPVPTDEASPVVGRFDTARTEENMALRFTSVPYTVLFAETRLRQETLSRFEERPGGSTPFVYNTDVSKDWREFRAGFDTSPWPRFSAGADFKHGDRHASYDPSQILNPAGYSYPGFFDWRDITEDQIETRLVYRATAWLRTSFNFRWRRTDFDSATRGISGLTTGGAISAGNEDARVYSFNAVLTPCRRLFLNETFSYTDSRASTAGNNANYLAPWNGNVFTVLSSATFQVSTNTGLHATYAFSKSNYGQDNTAGLPLGINYDRHELRFGITRRISSRLAGGITYGFSQYSEPSSGGAVDFNAHTVFATLSYAWK